MTALRLPTPAEVVAEADRLLERRKHDAPPVSGRQAITPSQPRQAAKPALTQRAQITPPTYTVGQVGMRILALIDQGLAPVEASYLAEAEARAQTLDRPGVRWSDQDVEAPHRRDRRLVWGKPDAATVGRHRVTLGGGEPGVRTAGLPAMDWRARVPVVDERRGR